MKRSIAVLLVLILVLAMTGCGNAQPQPQTQPTTAPTQPTLPPEPAPPMSVGICMPSGDKYWADSVAILEQRLQRIGCNVIIRYAQNNVSEQVHQVEQFVQRKVSCLIIAPVDSVALVEAEEKAKMAGIPIIAYDRLLMDTDAVNAVVTFDYDGIGVAMGQYIITSRKLETAAAEKRSYTIEFFMGSADDNCAVLLHKGLMSVLQPYLNSGVLVCKTGRTSFEDTYVQRWDHENARSKCLSYLEKKYANDSLDIVCAASDTVAQGVIAALTEKGYTANNWPLIIGQEGSVNGVKQILAGQQTMTVYKDTKVLAEKCAEIAYALMTGQSPEINDTASHYNHMITVPAYVCGSRTVDLQNYKEVLVDTGIYEESQFS